LRRALHTRLGRGICRLAGVFLLLAAAGVLQAQSGADDAAALSASGSASGAGPALTAGDVETIAAGSEPELAPLRIARRDALLGLAAWDHSLLGAFELGARLVELSSLTALSEPRVIIGPAMAVARPAGRMIRFSTSGSRVSVSSLASSLKLNQLVHQGMNLRMDSPFGNFRLTYREIFSGRPNSLGGGVGQASAAATYTTPRFGAGGLMDFSAAALMGTGAINTLLGNGFGNSVIGGNGPALRKNPGPTVALKLTF
jgi:hypothetical protein